jgi:hypothetical protein
MVITQKLLRVSITVTFSVIYYREQAKHQFIEPESSPITHLACR